MKAATAQPGEVLRRPANSRGELAKLKPAKKASAPAGPSKAALKKVADLETRLAALDADHEKAIAKLERQQARIAEDLAAAREEHAGQRARIEDALSAARRALG
ncbi:hypothetical protein [Phenylobacterium sp. J367]|uniref:hypothetical protein n=1 Tax=Phenylobacterium sp. J367 TaxID=2898435 RepID=UPI002150D6FD|nr:hypothetical protein [Phenylobacterium sp. J367]MCR5880043.1 hypothetical protein [Phenylobacterium sp. J367]